MGKEGCSDRTAEGMAKYMFIITLMAGIGFLIYSIKAKRKIKTKKEFALLVGYVLFLSMVFGMAAVEYVESKHDNPYSSNETVSRVGEDYLNQVDGSKDEISSDENIEKTVITELDKLQIDFEGFFTQYVKDPELELFLVYDGKYDLVCNLNGLSKPSEEMLVDLSEFIVKNNYRAKIMSVTLNMISVDGRKSIINVKDFSSEILPYVQFTLYKNGMVTTSSVSIDKEMLFKNKI